MSDAPREPSRFRFGPAETLALVGSLRISQSVVLLAGIGATLVVMRATPVVLAPLASAPLGLAALVAAVPVRGLVVLDWARLGAGHLARRVSGRRSWRSGAPARGARDLVDAGDLDLPTAWGRLRMIAAPHAGRTVGVLVDEAAQAASATLLVRVESFALLAEADQERRVAAWGQVLASLAREAGGVRRIAWVERTVPAEVDEIGAYFAAERDRDASLDSAAVLSYVDLIDSSSAAATEHECFVSVQVDLRQRRRELRHRAGSGGSRDAAIGAVVVDELRLVAQGLDEAGVGRVGALPPRLLAAAIRHAVDPGARPHLARLAAAGAEDGCAPAQAGPVALDEEWAAVRTDSAWHATFWISRWPLRDVGCLFLAPLLNRTLAHRSVALVAEPIPPSRAHRAAEREVVREEGDQTTRERHGFLQTARHRRRHEAALERERELADGHALLRFAGYVTVTAAARDELEAACAEVVQAAQHSNLELRRLVGEQTDALACTLPGLCRGLA